MTRPRLALELFRVNLLMAVTTSLLLLVSPVHGAGWHGVVAKLPSLPAPPAAPASLLEHRYYDCSLQRPKVPFDRRAADPGCQVFYSVRDARLAIRLKDSQQALAIPKLVEANQAVKARCATRADWMKLVGLDKSNPKMAAYTLETCKNEEEMVWLARALEALDQVDVAGVLVRLAKGSGEALLTDEILIAVEGSGGKPLVLPPKPEEEALIEAVGLEFVAPDPFDPGYAVLLQAKMEATEPPTLSFIHGVELLACVAAGQGEDAEAIVDPCIASQSKTRMESMTQAFNSAMRTGNGANGGTLRAALIEFRGLNPSLVRPTQLPVSPKAVEAGLDDWIKAERENEDDLTAKITFNSTSNETDTDDQAKLSVDASATYGSYPGQLRFDVGAQVEFDNDEVEENVTKILVNYDHYFKPWVQVYGFAERFSNTYLDLEQRWEGGGGMQIEWDARTKRRDDFCRTRGLGPKGYTGRVVKTTKNATRRLAQYRDKIRDELLREGFISSSTAKEYCTYQPGIAKRNAVFQAGLALSAFSDFEEPAGLDITARRLKREDPDDPTSPLVVDDEATHPDSMEATPVSSQTLRFTVRPTLTWRPLDKVEVEAWYYYKFSDDDTPDGDTDFRSEAHFEASLVLNDKDPKVTLKGSYTRYRDDTPPSVAFVDALSAHTLEQAMDAEDNDIPGVGIAADGSLFRLGGLVAEDRHSVVKFGVEVSF